MKIAVYNAKGSAGKTPIATNIALERDYAIGTNELFHVFEGFIPEERLLALQMEESFPEIPDDIDIVFDLAGSISEHSHSITSALTQADLVIVPVWNEVKALNATVGTIQEVARFTNNILVVATKLQKGRKETLPKGDWTHSEAFLNVKRVIDARSPFQVPVLPLKFSAVFDAIFEHEKSIHQLMEHDPLSAYNYREVSRQFDAIFDHIDKVCSHAEQKQLKRA
jgi:hypothetical protein